MEAGLIGLVMIFAMMSITMNYVVMMMETVVDYQPKKTFALNVLALVSWNLIAIPRVHA